MGESTHLWEQKHRGVGDSAVCLEARPGREEPKHKTALCVSTTGGVRVWLTEKNLPHPTSHITYNLARVRHWTCRVVAQMDDIQSVGHLTVRLLPYASNTILFFIHSNYVWVTNQLSA